MDGCIYHGEKIRLNYMVKEKVLFSKVKAKILKGTFISIVQNDFHLGDRSL